MWYFRAIMRAFAAWMMTSLVLLACTARGPAPVPAIEDAVPESAGVFQHILVLPFYDMATVFGPEAGVRGPLTDQVFVTGRTDPLASDFLSQDLFGLLRRAYPNRRITMSNAQVFDLKTLPGTAAKSELIGILQTVGKRRDADAVLVGFIYDYQEREGGDLGVRAPARLAIELNLVDVASGRLLWHREFSEIQQPLTENLLMLPQFLRRKGRWVSARQMARNAMQDMLKTIPETD